MIPKFQMTALRNAEYFQFISSASELFARFKVDTDNLGTLYGELDALLTARKRVKKETPTDNL